jgi:hypothetical protein
MAFLVATLVLYVSAPALAQETPAFEISGGYSLVRDQDAEENFHGWIASGAGNLNRWLAIAGEVGGNYKTIQVLGADIDLRMHSFFAGPRFSWRQVENITPSAQLLVGAVHGSGAVLGATKSNLEFALQPGGAVDFWLRKNFGIRVGGNYRRIFAEGEGTNQFQYHIGVALSAGVR